MNEELTNDWIEGALNTARQVTIMTSATVERLATALLEERAKPKVWDGAPDNAFRSIVNWYDKNRGFIKSKVLTRELPKTRARIIAEEIVRGINDEIYSDTKDIEYVEGVLKRYAEEPEGEA